MLYVVASWLLLQVADVLFEALELPAAWDRLVLALVILGFPIVLIFASFYVVLTLAADLLNAYLDPRISVR